MPESIRKRATECPPIPKLVLGTWGLGGNAYGKITEDHAVSVLRDARDLGISCFDTSPTYGDGQCERLLARAFSGDADVMILSKAGMLPHSTKLIPQDFSAAAMRTSVTSSLRRLKRDRIDILQMHSPQADYLQKFPDALGGLDDLISEGLVGSVALAARSPESATAQCHDAAWSFVQTNFSLLDQRLLDFRPLSSSAVWGARTVLCFGFLAGDRIPDTHDRSHHLSNWPEEQLSAWAQGARAFSALADGWSRSLYEVAVRAPFDVAGMDFIILGVMNSRQTAQALEAIRSPELSESEVREIRDLYRDLEEGLRVNSPYSYVDAREESNS